MKKSFPKQLVMIATLGLFSAGASAYTWQQLATTVTMVEATYSPAIVAFKVANTPSACSTGYMVWSPRGATATEKTDNAKAVFASLLVAKSSGNTINIFGTGCDVEFIHVE